MKTAYVFAIDGSEEIETLAPVDFLRRAEVSVRFVGVKTKEVVLSHGVRVLCDTTLAEVMEAPLPDLVVLPGGTRGAAGFHDSAALKEFVSRHMAESRLLGAICATPAHVLSKWGLLGGKNWTCYPGCEAAGEKPIPQRVVVDGNLITARGPGVSLEFSIALIEALCGAETASRVLNGTLTVLPEN